MCLLDHGGVKATAPLLNRPKMKGGRVRDSLNVIWRTKIGIRNRDCRLVRDRDRLGIGGSEIGIRFASIPDIPTRIHCELHKVREPSDLLGPGSLAAR